jgi:EamA domain-containing membrane protein RarD
VVYFYVTLLHPLDARQMYSWRLPLTAPLLATFLMTAGHRQKVIAVVRKGPAAAAPAGGACVQTNVNCGYTAAMMPSSPRFKDANH